MPEIDPKSFGAFEKRTPGLELQMESRLVLGTRNYNVTQLQGSTYLLEQLQFTKMTML